MKTIRNVLKCFDIYGEPVKLNINQKEKVKTVWGALLSLVAIALLISFTWAYGNDLSNSTTEDVQFYKRPFYNLNKYNFPVAFAFQTYDQNTFNIPKYFKFDVISVKTYNGNSTKVTTSLEYEPCNDSHFPSFSSDYLQAAGTSKYMCIKDQNLLIGGYWDNEYIQYVTFRLRMCNNGTDGNCAPKQEISDWIDKEPIAFNLYFQNNIVDMKNFENPIAQNFYVVYKNVRMTSSKVLNTFIKSQDIVTDVGYIFPSYQLQTAYSYDNSDTDESDALVGSLMDINLFVSDHKLVVNRRYIKAQTILAFLGGLGQLFYVVGWFLTFYFSRIKLHQKLFNKMLNINDDSKSDKPSPFVNRLATGLDRACIFTPGRPINNHNNSDNKKLRDDVESKKELSVRSEDKKGVKYDRPEGRSNDIIFRNKVVPLESCNGKGKLKLNCFERVTKCCRRKQAKFIEFEKARSNILNKLDISNLLLKVDEYEKFKMTLLNFEQLAMFQLLLKTPYNLEDHEKIESEKLKLREFMADGVKVSQLLANYKLKNGDRYGEIDKRIISMLDEEYRQML
jgi:hypothetical protein